MSLWTYLALALLTVIAGLLRWVDLGQRSLWLDEAIAYWASQPDGWEMVSLNSSVRATPPTFTWIIRTVSGWQETEAWLRTPAWLAGVAGVSATYYMARAFASRPLSLFPAALVAVSATQVGFSRLVSEYSLAFLLATLATGVFLRFLVQPDWRHGIALAVLVGTGCSVHYGIALLNLAFNLVVAFELLQRVQRRRLLKAWILVQAPLAVAAGLALAVLDLGWVFTGGGPRRSGYLDANYWDPWSLSSLARLVGPDTFAVFDFVAVQGALLAVLCVAGGVHGWGNERERSLVLLLIAAFTVGLAAAFVGLYPYGGTRHAFYGAPVMYAVATVGLRSIAQMKPRAQSWLLVTLVAGLLLVSDGAAVARNLRSPGFQEMQPIVEELEERRGDNDQLFVYHWALPAFRYYDARLGGVDGALAPPDLEWLPRVLDEDAYAGDVRDLERSLATSEPIWLIFAHCQGRGECEELREQAMGSRQVDLVARTPGVTLYRADAPAPSDGAQPSG